MVHHEEYMDVADSDFLHNNKEQLTDDDSEFETVFENYFAFSVAKNRFFARKLPLHVVLGSGKGMLACFFYISWEAPIQSSFWNSLLLAEIRMILTNLFESRFLFDVAHY